MQAKQCSGAEGEATFVLVEKKTFLEYVPNETAFMRRSASLPVLLGWSPVQIPVEQQLEEGGKKEGSKPVRICLPESSSDCTESDLASPTCSAASLRGEAWQLASTRGPSDQSLQTCFSAVSTPRTWSSLDWAEQCSTDSSSESEVHQGTSGMATLATSPDAGVTGVPLLPSASVGSVLHEARLCRPCAWYWRPGSCTRGAECLHCHLCPDGELASRRYRTDQMVKQRRRQSKGKPGKRSRESWGK